MNDYRPRNVKKSDFPADTELPDGAYLDFTLYGQNLKILKDDFLAALGVLGTIEQLGDITGAPVLKQTGALNQIRNIIGNSGVITSLSPNDGVQLDHNFIADSSGVPVLIDISETQPKVRSLLPGPGITLGIVNGSIQIATSEVPVSTKTVVVNVEDDFPAPVTGVITLEPNTFYLVTNDIVTTNMFVLQTDSILGGSDGTLIRLEYTGTGTMFTSVNNTNKIREITVKAPNGTLLDISATDPGKFFQILNSRIECGTIGTISGITVVNFDSLSFTNITVDGLTCSGHNSVISYSNSIATIDNGTFIDFGSSTFDGFSFLDFFGTVGAGATLMSGLAASGNVSPGGLATVINTRFSGTGTALSGITESDALWEFIGNNGFANSRKSALSINTGTTVTIGASDTPVVIGAGWVEQEASRFTTTAAGRFTYIGKGGFANLSASITADIASGVDDCSFFFAKNGAVISDSSITREMDSGDPGNLSVLWALEVETNDYIELFCQNDDATANIEIVKAIFRIN